MKNGINYPFFTGSSFGYFSCTGYSESGSYSHSSFNCFFFLFLRSVSSSFILNGQFYCRSFVSPDDRRKTRFLPLPEGNSARRFPCSFVHYKKNGVPYSAVVYLNNKISGSGWGKGRQFALVQEVLPAAVSSV